MKHSKLGLEVPYNWDISLFEIFDKINKNKKTNYPIYEVYASDKRSITGSGRAGNTLNERKEHISKHISEAHKYNIKFNYLFNAITLNGNEFDKKFRNNFLSQVESLAYNGIDVLTITNLTLILLVKKYFPDIFVASSVNNHLDSVERVRQLILFSNIDRIMMDHRVSRNFKLIDEVNNLFPDKQISVLVNESCLRDCVLQSQHQEYYSLMSRAGEDNNYLSLDICHAFCAKEKLQNPVLSLKAPWLRPEDIKYMFNSGASLVKLAGRTKSSQWIIDLVVAYTSGDYDGDVFQFIEKSGLVSPEWEIKLGKHLQVARYKINNKRLEGFIQPFVDGQVPCSKGWAGCGECRWCDEWTDTLTVPDNVAVRLIDLAKIIELNLEKN